MQDPAHDGGERGNAARGRKTALAAVLVGLGVTLAAVALPEPEGVAGQDPAPAGEGAGAPTDPAGEKEYADKFVARFQRAQKLFYVKKDEEAAALLRELIKEQPDAGAVHHALGFVEWQRGNTEVALAAFRDASKWSPKDGAVRRDTGFRLLEAGHAAEALPHLDAAHELVDFDVEIEVARGRALQALGKTAEAEKMLRAALKGDADSVDARVTLGYLVCDRDPDEAITLTNPIPENWPDVVILRATAFARKGQTEDAVKRCLRILEVAPPAAAGVPALAAATDIALSVGDVAASGKLAEAWAAAEAESGAVAPATAVSVAVARSARGKAKEGIEALDAAPLPAKAPAALRGTAGLVRVHLLLQTGDVAAATKAAEAVAALEDAPFERAAARRILGLGEAPTVPPAGAAGSEIPRANDLAWIEGLAAWRRGDAAAAAAHMASAAKLSTPRGEHPGLLAATAFPPSK